VEYLLVRNQNVIIMVQENEMERITMVQQGIGMEQNVTREGIKRFSGILYRIRHSGGAEAFVKSPRERDNNSLEYYLRKIL
jgi:hypothetical protein